MKPIYVKSLKFSSTDLSYFYECFDIHFLRKEKIYTKLKYSRCPQYDIVSGGFAGTVTMPADVIKTRLQLELGETGIRMTSRHVIKEIISNQGYRGFYNGLVPRILKVSPACAIMMSSYEFCKYYFHTLNLRAS